MADELYLARKEYSLALDKYHKAIAGALPKGATVKWMHGKQHRSGVVIDVSFERVKVRSSGEFWIYIDRIISLTRKDDKLQGGDGDE